ncbi:MAG: GAF domain-containing protein, partial [Candidatus Limnocylindrales bacterium]
MPARTKAASPSAKTKAPARSPKRNGGSPSPEPAAHTRLAKLEALDADRERALKVEDALYRIADTASSIQEMAEFYSSMHAIVGELMNAKNFYIALYDDERQLLNFPYYVDEIDTDPPDPDLWEPIGVGAAAGITAYAVRRGQPLRLNLAEYLAMVDKGLIEKTGGVTYGDDAGWLGVPLKADDRTVGMVVVNDYHARFTKADLDLLTFVGQHIGTALGRARAIEETRERNAELAVINEIGAALAMQLDFDAIVELVGEKVREIFDVQTIAIALYDEGTGKLTFPFTIDEGKRATPPVIEFGEGLTSTIIRERRALLIGEDTVAEAAAAIRYGTPTESFLGVPILAGERVIGTINLED